MRLSELSAATGVSVPTLKYYLREGLCRPAPRSPPDQPVTTSPTPSECT